MSPTKTPAIPTDYAAAVNTDATVAELAAKHATLGQRLQEAEAALARAEALQEPVARRQLTADAAVALADDPDAPFDEHLVPSENTRQLADLRTQVAVLKQATHLSFHALENAKDAVRRAIAEQVRTQTAAREATALAEALVAAAKAAEAYVAAHNKLARAGIELTWPLPNFLGPLQGASPVGAFLRQLHYFGATIPADGRAAVLSQAGDWHWPR